MSRRAAAADLGTAERLLDAAELEFAAMGYASARLADIAARTGIRRPSLLYHFATKDVLYRAVVERVFGLLGDVLMRAISSGGAFEQQFDAVVLAFAGFVRERPSLAPIIVRELIDDPKHGDVEDAARRGGSVGHAIVLERVVPLLDMVEAFMRTQGAAYLRPQLPVRAAIVQVSANLLLHGASGTLATPLWGPDTHALQLAKLMFFSKPE